MGEFYFNRQTYQDATQQITNASKDFESAKERVAAVNKDFLGKVGGTWATAEDAITGEYEATMRVSALAVANLAKNMKQAGDAALQILFTSRDGVFQAVGAHCSHPDVASLKDGDVSGAGTQAQFGSCEVAGEAIKAGNECHDFRRCGNVASILNQLKQSCRTCQHTIMDVQDTFSSYKSDVGSWDSTYSSTFSPANFTTGQMYVDAIKATASNIGVSPKYGVKAAKSFMSDVGTILKGEHNFPWNDSDWKGAKDWAKGGKGKFDWKGYKANFTKKLSEGTHGILNFQEEVKGKSLFAKIKQQQGKNIDDFRVKKNLGKIDDSIERVKDFASKSWYEKNTGGKVAAAHIEKLQTTKKLAAVGKGFKAAGRFLGIAGDAFTIAEIADNAAKAASFGDYGSMGGQIAKGVLKMGTAKVIGAAVGAAFGGPLGMIAGVAIAGAVQMGTDWLWDKAFQKLGTKTYADYKK